MEQKLSTKDKKLIEKTIRAAKKSYSDKEDIAAYVESSLSGNKKLLIEYVDKLLEIERPPRADPNNKLARPVCKYPCPYWQDIPSPPLQRNALRMETHGSGIKWRCGWNVKPGCLGGRPWDYAACINPPTGQDAMVETQWSWTDKYRP